MHIIPVYIGYCVSKALLLKVWFVGQQCCLIRKLVRNAESCYSQVCWLGICSLAWLPGDSCHINAWGTLVECSLPRGTFQSFNYKQHCDEHMFSRHFSGGLYILHCQRCHGNVSSALSGNLCFITHWLFEASWGKNSQDLRGSRQVRITNNSSSGVLAASVSSLAPSLTGIHASLHVHEFEDGGREV